MEYHITLTDSAQSALELLAVESGLSKTQIKQAMQKGALWCKRGRSGREKGSKQAQRTRRVPKNLKTGDSLHLYYDAKVLSELPPEPQMIADEGAYSVWYKPYGMRSQGSKWGDHCALYRWVEVNHKPEKPAFLVHRLDRAATGLILVAHSKKAAVALTKLFEERNVDKRYQVIVVGQFSEQSGVWAKKQTFTAEVDGKAATSHARCLAYDAEKDRSLLEVTIETGRKHQIRYHLAAAGFPVVGDRLYGNAKTDEQDLQLTASLLSFVCPISHEERLYELPRELLPVL
ncbi:Ribosomal large subunit pseudouridine synthase D [gamma proteobacterium IMCC2047]|nr:Ribosomal large subunit pseudouridine synthase D [gamma proteobacterium IMCC2047]